MSETSKAPPLQTTLKAIPIPTKTRLVFWIGFLTPALAWSVFLGSCGLIQCAHHSGLKDPSSIRWSSKGKRYSVSSVFQDKVGQDQYNITVKDDKGTVVFRCELTAYKSRERIPGFVTAIQADGDDDIEILACGMETFCKLCEGSRKCEKRKMPPEFFENKIPSAVFLLDWHQGRVREVPLKRSGGKVRRVVADWDALNRKRWSVLTWLAWLVLGYLFLGSAALVVWSQYKKTYRLRTLKMQQLAETDSRSPT